MKTSLYIPMKIKLGSSHNSRIKILHSLQIDLEGTIVYL